MIELDHTLWLLGTAIMNLFHNGNGSSDRKSMATFIHNIFHIHIFYLAAPYFFSW